MAKKILIIEDEESLRKILGERLKEEGYDVAVSKDGKEGLAKALNWHPDLMLVDIVMPVMDGVEMIKELQKDRWGKEAKILLLTNLSDPVKMAKITSELNESMSVYDYLVKSDWDLAKIAEKIKKKLDD